MVLSPISATTPPTPPADARHKAGDPAFAAAVAGFLPPPPAAGTPVEPPSPAPDLVPVMAVAAVRRVGYYPDENPRPRSRLLAVA